MIDTFIAVGYFVLALSGDYLSVEWQEARLERRAAACANIGLALGALSWIPVALFVVTFNWQIIVADLIGGWLGAYIAVKRRG